MFRISWKAKPHGLSQTARSDGGTIRKARKIFPPTRADSPVMHQCIFAEGRPFLLLNPAGNGKHKSSHREKRREQCFIFQIAWKFKPQGLSQTARSDGGTIWKARKIFPRQGPTLPLCTGVFLQRGGPVLPPIPLGMGNTKVPTEEKSGSSVLYSRLHENSSPMDFPKLLGAMVGQFRRRGRFFPRRGSALPLCTGVFLQRGGTIIFPNPEWDGNTKLPLLLQKVGVVFIKAKPIDKAGGKKTEKGLGGASCILPQPLRMRKLKCMPPPAFQAAFSFPPVKTSCFIGVQCIY